MSVRVTRPDPPAIERIRQHRRPAKSPRPNSEALRTLHDVVRRSNTVEDAIAAVNAIRTAWSAATEPTLDAAGLLIMILELSDTIDEALTTWTKLRNDGALLKPLTAIRQFVRDEFPEATMRIVPGDEVASAYLDVRIPTRDYPSFRDAHVRLRNWIIGAFPNLDRVIHTSALPAVARV